MRRKSHLPIYIFQSVAIHAGLLLLAGYLMPIHKLSDIRNNPYLGIMEVTEVEYVSPPSQPIPEPPPAKKPPKKIFKPNPVAANRKTFRTQPPSTPSVETKTEAPLRTVEKRLALNQANINVSSPKAAIRDRLDLDKFHEASPSAKSEKISVNPRAASNRSVPLPGIVPPNAVIGNQNPSEEKRPIVFDEPQKSSPYVQPQPNTAKEMPPADLSPSPQGGIEIPAGDNGDGNYPLYDKPEIIPGAVIPDLSASLKIDAGANPSHQNADKQPIGHIESNGGLGRGKPLALPSHMDISAASRPQTHPNPPLEHRMAYLNNPSRATAGINMPTGQLARQGNTASPALPWITLEQETEAAQDNPQTLTVEDPAFDLKGQINAGVETAFLSVNDQVQQLDLSGGNFSAKVKLRPGLNNLKVSAIDSSGRYASKGVTVNYTPLDISYSGDWTIYVNDALPESQYIYAVTGDRYGNKWFGLAGGVARFNGSSWIKYTVRDGLAGHHVRAITEDTHGGMWFGTEKGVSYFNGSRWITYNCSPPIHRGNNDRIYRGENNQGCPTGLINAIVCGPDGKVWIGTQEGLFMFNGETWKHFAEKDGLPHNQINALVLDKSGNLWIGTPSGAGMYDGRNWKVFTVKDGLSHDAVYAIASDIKGKLWFGTEYGVSCFDGQNWARYTVEDGLSDNQVNAIAIDKANNAWFGTDNGVSRFSKDIWAQFTKSNGLASDQVNTVHAESNDRIWFGTSRGVTELNTRYAGHTTRR